MGARIHCLHILFISFEKMSFEAAIEKSQKNVEFSFQNFQGFLLLFPEGGTGLGLPGHLALLALVEAWRSRGRWVAEGGPPNPFSSVAPSLLMCCSWLCLQRLSSLFNPVLCRVLFFFSLTLNKKCDRAGGLFSSPIGDRAGVRRKGEKRPEEAHTMGEPRHPPWGRGPCSKLQGTETHSS